MKIIGKKKILIIAPYQFGELSDCYYWAKYATLAGYSVTYIGYRYLKREIKERCYGDVNVIGVHHYDNRYLLGLLFFGRIIMEIILGNYNNIIACYFPYVKILNRIFPKRNIIVDIRTLSVHNDPKIRSIEDSRIKDTILYFKKRSVISEGVRSKLGLDAYILPLGAECISTKLKDFNKLKFFYIGTFDNRNLHIFIKGLADAYRKYDIPVSFDIVGGGNEQSTTLIKNTIKKENADFVNLHGYLTHDEAQYFFDNCNIGVAYVPITEYYEYQPATKLYEYLLSGMACIATKTQSNINVITEQTGILVDDDADSICNGIFYLYCNLKRFNSSNIIAHSMRYHWKRIVENNFLKLFKA